VEAGTKIIIIVQNKLKAQVPAKIFTCQHLKNKRDREINK
jgi:hypothetical protein